MLGLMLVSEDRLPEVKPSISLAIRLSQWECLTSAASGTFSALWPKRHPVQAPSFMSCFASSLSPWRTHQSRFFLHIECCRQRLSPRQCTSGPLRWDQRTSTGPPEHRQTVDTYNQNCFINGDLVSRGQRTGVRCGWMRKGRDKRMD